MNNYNLNKKRIVSICLIMVLWLSLISPNLFVKGSFAKSMFSDPAITASNLQESKIDAQRDKSAGSKAGNWAEARGYGLSWNAFHNGVQKNILLNNKSKMDSEITVDFKDKDGNVNEKNEKGTYGRVDLVCLENGKSYIWEVKPQSYEVNPNRNKAKRQLGHYINDSVPRDDRYKRKKLCEGTGTLGLQLSGFCYVAPYVVEYEYGGDGIILYKFYKDDEKEKNPQEALAASKEQQKTTTLPASLITLYRDRFLKKSSRIYRSRLVLFLMLQVL